MNQNDTDYVYQPIDDQLNLLSQDYFMSELEKETKEFILVPYLTSVL